MNSWVAALQDEVLKRDAVIKQVRALHRPTEEFVVYSDGAHDECDTCQAGPGHLETVCSHCHGAGEEYWTFVPFPCPTIRALDGAS